MPVYEYKCVECLERFEVEQSMSDKTLTQISGKTHTHKVKKVFSPVGISFKGSGFYKNDSAKKSPKSTSSAETGSGKNGSSSASTSSTTPEKKTTKETSSTKASTKSD